MTTNNNLGFKSVKVVAIGVGDSSRAKHFYSSILALEPAIEGGQEVGYLLGDTVVMLKDDWATPPAADPIPRVTFEVDDARQTQELLAGRGVKIADAVQLYDDAYYVGSFLDSEGNKIWFCSNP